MIGLQNSIYATLFPHLRGGKKPDGSVNHPSGNSYAPYYGEDQVDPEALLTNGMAPEAAQSATLPNYALPRGDGTTTDYATANEAYNQAQFGAAQPQPLAPTPDFEPPAPNKEPISTRDALALKPAAIDTTGLERAITKTPYDEAKENAAKAASTPAKKQKGWKQALWIALQGADMVLNKTDPKNLTWLGEEKKNRAVAKANAELAPLQKIENEKQAQIIAAQKQQKAAADYRAVMLNNDGKVLDNATKAGKLAYESLNKKDYITPAEAKSFKEKYGLEITPYDARKFKTAYENGVPYSTPELGLPEAIVNPTMPIRKREIEVPVNVGGSKGYSTSEGGLKMKIDAEKDKVQQQIQQQTREIAEENRQQDRVYQSQKELNNDLQRWQSNETTRQQKLTTASTQLAKITALRDAQVPNSAEYDAFAKEAAELAGQVQGLSIAEPKPKGVVVPQTIRGKQVSVKGAAIGKGASSFEDALNRIKSVRK